MRPGQVPGAGKGTVFPEGDRLSETAVRGEQRGRPGGLGPRPGLSLLQELLLGPPLPVHTLRGLNSAPAPWPPRPQQPAWPALCPPSCPQGRDEVAAVGG